MQINKELITAEEIKNKFLGTDEKDYTLCKVIDYHNTQMKESLAWGTMKNYFTTQKYIQMFLKVKFGTPDIYLSQLTYKFIAHFEYYLRNYKPLDHHKPLGNNGVMKHIERFRKMINMAVRMEWVNKDPFAKYKQKFDKVNREFLSKEELAKIENRELSVVRLQWVRDLFVFSCYTGLAYIDTMRLSPANITIGIDSEYWLITKRQKTSNPVRVPLLPKALQIIDKYKGHPRALTEGTLFPVISNQKLNSYLKEIADLCGIHKNLTFHLARHTFATTIMLTNGVPIESVSKMLGHSKITTTQVYAKVIEQKLSVDMKTLKEKLASDNIDKGFLRVINQ
jgi:site-specific recombinase XerD